MSEKLDKLRKRIRELKLELDYQEETELIARGCYRCHGAIENGPERRSVLMVGPNSHHILLDGRPSAQAQVVCIECWEKICAFLAGTSSLYQEEILKKARESRWKDH